MLEVQGPRLIRIGHSVLLDRLVHGDLQMPGQPGASSWRWGHRWLREQVALLALEKDVTCHA
jgi:hypothetical protein